MKKKLPNLLLVGMAKCGTSSLSQYLSQHPDIFMPKQKEPRFISSQIMRFPLNGPKDKEVESWYIKDYNDYIKLFENANQKVIAEASADTMYYYKQTIPVVKKYFGDPKILIILRNPVERAFSSFQHLKRDDREPLTFEDGLKNEKQRIEDNWELIYYYKSAGHYSEAVKAFFTHFSSVKVVFSDELNIMPEKVLNDIFYFLKIDQMGSRIKTHLKYNISGIPKSRLAHKVLFEKTLFGLIIKPIIRILLPLRSIRVFISAKLINLNLFKSKINEETEFKLRAYFMEDINKLEKILNKDLNHWKK